MLYSVLERHNDGSYWHHGKTFNTREEAEKFMADWIPWDPQRGKRIIEHQKPLPNEPCCTFDFKNFGFAGEIYCTL